ncbi:FkbM family methyltransferase [Aquirufa sp. ROCK2-A2]
MFIFGQLKKVFICFQVFGIRGFVLLLKKYLNFSSITPFSSSHLLHPLWLRNHSSDFSVFYQIFLKHEYAINFAFEPKVILDCGANVGLASVYFKNRFPQSKIISIEPDRDNFDMLLQNTRGYSDVFCVKGAVWNKETNLIIKDQGIGSWGFMIEESSLQTNDSIKSYTIAQLMTQFGIDQIDILKIDIEGSEKELFESNFETWLPKTKVIIIELHDKMRAGSTRSFFNALSTFDYSLEMSGENLIVFLNQEL